MAGSKTIDFYASMSARSCEFTNRLTMMPALIVVFTFIIVSFSFLPSSTTLQIPHSGIVAQGAPRGKSTDFPYRDFSEYACGLSNGTP